MMNKLELAVKRQLIEAGGKGEEESQKSVISGKWKAMR
jgi:hypothetical protein